MDVKFKLVEVNENTKIAQWTVNGEVDTHEYPQDFLTVKNFPSNPQNPAIDVLVGKDCVFVPNFRKGSTTYINEFMSAIDMIKEGNADTLINQPDGNILLVKFLDETYGMLIRNITLSQKGNCDFAITVGIGNCLFIDGNMLVPQNRVNPVDIIGFDSIETAEKFAHDIAIYMETIGARAIEKLHPNELINITSPISITDTQPMTYIAGAISMKLNEVFPEIYSLTYKDIEPIEVPITGGLNINRTVTADTVNEEIDKFISFDRLEYIKTKTAEMMAQQAQSANN